MARSGSFICTVIFTLVLDSCLPIPIEDHSNIPRTIRSIDNQAQYPSVIDQRSNSADSPLARSSTTVTKYPPSIVLTYKPIYSSYVGGPINYPGERVTTPKSPPVTGFQTETTTSYQSSSTKPPPKSPPPIVAVTSRFDEIKPTEGSPTSIRPESPADQTLVYKPNYPSFIGGPVDYPGQIIKPSPVGQGSNGPVQAKPPPASIRPTNPPQSNVDVTSRFDEVKPSGAPPTSTRPESPSDQSLVYKPNYPSFIGGPVDYPGQIIKPSSVGQGPNRPVQTEPPPTAIRPTNPPQSNIDVTSRFDEGKPTEGSRTSTRPESPSDQSLVYKPNYPSFIGGPVDYPGQIIKPSPVGQTRPPYTASRPTSPPQTNVDVTSRFDEAQPTESNSASNRPGSPSDQSLVYKPNYPSFIGGPVNYPGEIIKPSSDSPVNNPPSTTKPTVLSPTNLPTKSPPTVDVTSRFDEVQPVETSSTSSQPQSSPTHNVVYKPIYSSFFLHPVLEPIKPASGTTGNNPTVTSKPSPSVISNIPTKSPPSIVDVTSRFDDVQPNKPTSTTKRPESPADQSLVYKPIYSSFIGGPVNYPGEIIKPSTGSQGNRIPTSVRPSSSLATNIPTKAPQPTVDVVSRFEEVQPAGTNSPSKPPQSPADQSLVYKPNYPSFIGGPVDYPGELIKPSSESPGNNPIVPDVPAQPSTETTTSSSTPIKPLFPCCQYLVYAPYYPYIITGPINYPGASGGKPPNPSFIDGPVNYPSAIIQSGSATMKPSGSSTGVESPADQSLVYKPIHPSYVNGPTYPSEIIRPSTITPGNNQPTTTKKPIVQVTTKRPVPSAPPANQGLVYKPIYPSYIGGPVDYPGEIIRPSPAVPVGDNQMPVQPISTSSLPDAKPIDQAISTRSPAINNAIPGSMQKPADQSLQYQPMYPSFIGGPVDYPGQIIRPSSDRQQ